MRADASLQEAVESAHQRRAQQATQRQNGGAALARQEQWVLAAHPHRERGVLLDVARRVLTRREGEPGRVDWDRDELLSLTGRVDVILHNHPRGTSVGDDDAYLAFVLNAREVDAITPTLRYRLRRLTDSWPEGFHQGYLSEQTILAGEMRYARDVLGTVDDEQIEATFYDVLWGRVASLYPNRVSYSVERRE